MGISLVFTLLLSVLIGPTVFANTAYHSLILKSDGSLHTFGYNAYGQLGDGSTNQRTTPTQILASGVSQIAAGSYHSLILKSDGSLHTFGYNNNGQLGDGSTTQRNTPTQILASGVSQISAGRYHSLILKSDGSLHTFGRNSYGQLGDGTTNQRNTPTQILASGVARLSEQSGYQSANNGHTITIASPPDGSTITENNDTLQVSITYQSSGGGYQTPTWAYRIGSGFPNYGSPHGGTQVTGSTTKSNFLSGQAYGYKTVYVALLDQGGNLHNPPVTQSRSFNYQSSGGGYQTPTGNSIAITSPSYNGQNITSSNDNLSVNITYQSSGGGYQTPTWAYRIGSGFPNYGSPHGGTQVTGSTTKSNFLSGQAYGYKTVYVALLDQSGNLHNPPVTQSRSFNYQSSGGGYQTPGGGYQTPGSGYQSPGGGYQTPGGNTSQPTTPVVLKPIVETLSFSLIQKQITLYGNSSQSVTQDSFIKVGFLLSSLSTLDPLDPSTKKIASVLQVNGKFSSNYSLPEGKTFYAKAFAENDAGAMYGRTLKISLSAETDPGRMNSEEKAVYLLEKDAKQINGGWIQNNWFGTFKDFGNGWIYHADHGWIYLSADSNNGLWAWFPHRGWVWTQENLYPFLYQINIGDWLYCFISEDGKVFYYSYQSKAFEERK